MNTQEKLRHALNAPGWLIAAVGVLGIAVGIRVIQAATGIPNQIR
jgi:xanthosine utilization system XapX-like protein